MLSNSETGTRKSNRQGKMLVADAKILCDKIEKTTIHPGDTWYLILHKWWERFLEFKDNLIDDSYIEMPPISNEKLVELSKNGEYVLRPGQVEGLNFALLPEDAFNKLRTVFGIEKEDRDIIKRVVVPGTLLNNEPFVEIYLKDLKIANFSKRDEVLTIKISFGDSVDSVRDKMMEALHIDDEARAKARFITEETNGKFEPLPPSISQTKLSSLLTSGITIFVDATGNAPLDEINGMKRTSIYLRGSQNQPGVCGLHNLGNTCFMNSALQCLSNVPELTRYFLSGQYVSELNSTNPLGTTGELARAYAELIECMWSGNSSSVRPGRLKTVIGQFAPRFNGYAQQDSQELTAFVLDGLHEDLNRIRKKPYIEEKEADGRSDVVVAQEAWEDYKKRNDSIIVDLMHGQLKSTLICPICEKISVKFDPFCFLSLPVPAKERQAKSTIVLVRSQKENQKWAKFALTHTNKTTVGQALKAIKENLGISQETRIVMIPNSNSSMNFIDVLSDDTLLVNTSYSTYYTRNFFAFIVNNGPLLIIDNKIMSNSIASYSYNIEKSAAACPIVINSPSRIDMDFIICSLIMDHLKDLLFVDEKENAVATGAIKVPAVVELHRDGSLSVINEKTPPIEVEKSSNTPRLVLKWPSANQSLFKSSQLESLIERELTIPGTQKRYFSLLESIDCFTTQEQLDENDTWYCPRCKEHRRAFKKLELWSLPKILIIHLKRFQYTRYSRDKIDTEIQIPTKVLDPAQKNSLVYNLIGISNHSGGLGAGHYTAKAFNSSVGWCEFNDSYASRLDNELPETMNSREAYLLFYQRRESPSVCSQSTQRKTRLSSSTNLSSANGSTSISASRRRISESSNSKMDTD